MKKKRIKGKRARRSGRSACALCWRGRPGRSACAAEEDRSAVDGRKGGQRNRMRCGSMS